MSVARSIYACRKEVLLIDLKTQLGAAWIHQCEESMLRQAFRLFIKMTGNPAFCAGRSHQQSPKRDCFAPLAMTGLGLSGLKDILWPIVNEGSLTGE